MRAFAKYGTIAVSAGLLSLVMSIELKTAPGVVSAAEPPKFTDTERFQCVTEVGPAQTGLDNPFLPGVYRTVINVYNPNDFAVAFTKRAVIARSQRSPRGIISLPQVETLQAGEAVGIDCVDISNLLGGNTQPVGNGVMIIQAGDNLKVIPAYTQAAPLS
jgi:hypothetical protein